MLSLNMRNGRPRIPKGFSWHWNLQRAVNPVTQFAVSKKGCKCFSDLKKIVISSYIGGLIKVQLRKYEKELIIQA